MPAVTSDGTAALLPITAVSFSPDGAHLFVGSGCCVYVYHTHSGALLTAHPALPAGSTVHGVVCKPCSADSSLLVVVFGQLRLSAFTMDSTNLTNPALETTFLLDDAADWILAANALETTDGFLRREWGTNRAALVIGFAHNFVEVWNCPCTPTGEAGTLLGRVQCVEQTLLRSMKLFAVSRADDNACSVVAASATVMGEAILWSPVSVSVDEVTGRAGSSISPTLTGVDTMLRAHSADTGSNGIVCNVALMHAQDSDWPGDARSLLMCTVSDDRTVRLWCKEGSLNNIEPAEGAQQREWNHCWSSFGHAARIWQCDMWRGGVVTSSEDCTCRLWGWDSGELLSTLQGHSGKHVWSIAILQSGNLLASGGGDASVKLWSLSGKVASSVQNSSMASAGASSSGAHRQCALHLPSLTEPSRTGKADFVRTVMLRPNAFNTQASYELLVSTNNGCLYSVVFDHEQAVEGNERWKLLHCNGEHSYVSMGFIRVDTSGCQNQDSSSNTAAAVASTQVPPCWNGDLVLLGSHTGDLVAVPLDLVAVNNDSAECVPCYFGCSWKGQELRVLGLMPPSPFMACVQGTPSVCTTFFSSDPCGGLYCWALLTSSNDYISLSLHCKFELSSHARVCTIAVSPMPLATGTSMLVAGDHKGMLTIFQFEDPASAAAPATPSLLCTCKAHGKDRVTCVVLQPGETVSDTVLLSAGRNGSVNHFSLIQEKYGDPITLKPFLVDKVGNFVSSVEQLYTNGSGDLILVGFHSVNFVAWNLTSHYQLLSVECGGARRSFSLALARPDRWDTFILAFDRDSEIKITANLSSEKQSDTAPPTQEMFTQACLHSQQHGREVNEAVIIYDCNNVKFVATASEDTTVKISAVRDTRAEAAWGGHPIKVVQTLQSHCSAVRSLSCAPLSDGSRLLVSCGGKEEMSCWHVQNSQTGMIPECRLLSSFQRGLYRPLGHAAPRRSTVGLSNDGKEGSELIDVRYFAVCALRIEMEDDTAENSSSNRFLIIAATSDGKLLVYGFQVNQSRCHVLAELQRGPTVSSTVLSLAVQSNSCVQHCNSNQPTFVGAGTSDGYVHMFDITQLCQQYRTSAQQAGNTDAVIAFFAWRPHLSGINCLHLIDPPGPTTAGNTSVLVVSGGDDQALGASMLSVGTGTDTAGTLISSVMHQVHVDNAHWAAVTATAIICLESEVHVVSVGCDQRLRVWKLLSKSDRVQPHVLSEHFVHALQVADPSTVTFTISGTGPDGTTVQLLVAGMGMEAIDLLI